MTVELERGIRVIVRRAIDEDPQTGDIPGVVSETVEGDEELELLNDAIDNLENAHLCQTNDCKYTDDEGYSRVTEAAMLVAERRVLQLLAEAGR